MRVLMMVFFVLGVSLSPDGLHAFTAQPGPAFSNPDVVVFKPEAWRKEPIHRQELVDKAQVAITLDQHLYPAYVPLIEAYAKERGIEIAVREGTCGNSEGLLNKKQVDIAGFCCPASASDRLPGLVFHTVGIEGLAILVHKDNPVENLTGQQVRDLFSGKIRNWSEVLPVEFKDKFSLPVRPVGRLHCPARPGHWRLILNDKDQFSMDLVEVGSIPEEIAAVGSYAGTVGYEILWNLERFDQKKAVKAIRVNGVSVEDAEALVDGVYPFFRVNTLTHWENPESANPDALRLVEHIVNQAVRMPAKFHVVPAQRLQEAGWLFQGDELIGLPSRHP